MRRIGNGTGAATLATLLLTPAAAHAALPRADLLVRSVSSPKFTPEIGISAKAGFKACGQLKW